MIEIKEVKGRRALKKFATYPIELYKDCPYFVPSLIGDEMNIFNKKKNFNLAHNVAKGFLCYKDGKLVGRIAGLINYRDNELRNKKMIRFSRLECIDDIEVFKALIGAVEKFGQENGMDIIHGPWGFNDTDREGMLTYGFDQRSTYATNYSYPYFHERLEELGFEPESKWVEYKFHIPENSFERIDSLAERIEKKLGVVDVVETMPIKKVIKKYGHKLYDTANEAYGHLDGYVPVEGKAIDNVMSQFGTICNPRYVSVLVDENDEVAAFGVIFPSICNALIKNKGRLFPFGFIDILKAIKKPKELEMALTGVKHKYKNTGINSIMLSKLTKHIIEDKIIHIESNPMLEHNFSIQQQWKFTEHDIVKRRQTYTKQIGSLIK